MIFKLSLIKNIEMVSTQGITSKITSKHTSKNTSNADLDLDKQEHVEKKNMQIMRSKFF